MKVPSMCFWNYKVGFALMSRNNTWIDCEDRKDQAWNGLVRNELKEQCNAQNHRLRKHDDRDCVGNCPECDFGCSQDPPRAVEGTGDEEWIRLDFSRVIKLSPLGSIIAKQKLCTHIICLVRAGFCLARSSPSYITHEMT